MFIKEQAFQVYQEEVLMFTVLGQQSVQHALQDMILITGQTVAAVQAHLVLKLQVI